MMKSTIFITVLLLISACGGEKPASPDGDGAIELLLVDTTGTMPGTAAGESAVFGGVKVSLQALTHEYVDTGESDENGVAGFSGLPAGEYTVFARSEKLFGAKKTVFTGFADLAVRSGGVSKETLYLSAVEVSGLIINELYYFGSDYSKFYFYDQFVELYNASADTLYLDGCLLARNSSLEDLDIESIDYVFSTCTFQFPGTPLKGRQYPIYPGQYVVVASDAIDHSLYASNAVDLSEADWEFFNPLGSDWDAVGVPNVNSVHPTSGVDFLISLGYDAVVLATGEEYGVEYYINNNGYESMRMTMPLRTVVDGVEYSLRSDNRKELTMRVDAGRAGVGGAKYSGQSIERREIGLDNNNSTFDFVLLDVPTPGYTHVE